jgi:hypothetical protein
MYSNYVLLLQLCVALPAVLIVLICILITFLTNFTARPSETEFLDEPKRQISQAFSSFLFTVTSKALPWDFYFFKLTQPLTVSRVQLLYSVKKGGRRKTWQKPYPLLYGLRNPYRILKSQDSSSFFIIKPHVVWHHKTREWKERGILETWWGQSRNHRTARLWPETSNCTFIN